MILIAVILLSSWGFVQGDYKCICNYNVEKNVLSQASANADVIGYMYEFDCKPEAGSSGDDAWLAVAFEHKVGYVQKDPQIQIQTCPGSIPDEDKLPPETTPTTSTGIKTTAAPETTTMSQTTQNSISTTKFVTTEQSITSTQQPTTEPTTELTTEQTTEPTTETTTETTTEPTTELTTEQTTEPITEATTEPRAEQTTEPATLISMTNTTPAQTTVLESTTTIPSTSFSTPDTTTPEPMTSSTKLTTQIPTTISSTAPSSSTTIPTTFFTSPKTVVTNAPTATSVLQGHTELCPDNVIQHSHRTGSILNQYGDKCYEVVQSGISWSHAESNCRDLGGHLVHIANQQEQDFIYHFLVRIHSHTVWIGLHDRNQEEHFEWSSGDPVTYENWLPGRKDIINHYSQDCVFMTPVNGQWDDVSCGGDSTELIQGVRHAYICQYATGTPTNIGSVAQGDISLCPYSVRQQTIKDHGILVQYKHNCYELIAHSSYPWSYAERICHSRGGHLAHIQNQQEQDYLQGFLQQHTAEHAVWIGLSDRQSEGHFEWSSHDAVVFTNWVPEHTSNFVSHHDEDCVVLIPYKGGQWDDIPCGHEGTSIFGDINFYGETHPLICQYNTVSVASLVG